MQMNDYSLFHAIDPTLKPWPFYMLLWLRWRISLDSFLIPFPAAFLQAWGFPQIHFDLNSSFPHNLDTLACSLK